VEGLLLQLPSNTISLGYLTILKTTCAKSLTNKGKGDMFCNSSNLTNEELCVHFQDGFPSSSLSL
jgi:hypothetical protein